MAIILFDLDATLANHHQSLEKDYRSLASPDEDLSLLWQKKPPQFVKERKKLIRSQRDWWLNLEVLPLGKSIYNAALNIGFMPYILTKGSYRHAYSWTEKFFWVRKHFPEAKITITEDKSLFYGNVLVDDYPDYVLPWLKRNNGIAIVPAYEYNKDCIHPSIVRWDGTDIAIIETALKKVFSQCGQL
jgi:FMN phosphatase YigB (HAD superfamily)